MSKASRGLIFSITFIMGFLLSILFFLMFFSTLHSKESIFSAILHPIYYIPFIFYLLVGALILAITITSISYFVVRSQLGKTETKIQLLESGQYEAVVFKDNIENNMYPTGVDATIEKLRQKLISLQQEIQSYSSQPQLLEGESKEVILEQERHRLARELHDSVSQQLFAAMMMLSALNEVAQKTNQSDQFLKSLHTVESVINEAQSEMRALLLHLRPINLEGKSLKDGIIQLINELKTKVQIKIIADIDDVKLPTSVEDHLFRIVQELLSNTLRHAKATELEVYLKQVNQTVLLKVIDDGVGFDLEKQAQTTTGSYGLKNIQERANGIGANAKIISFPGKGTSVEIRVPLLKESILND